MEELDYLILAIENVPCNEWVLHSLRRLVLVAIARVAITCFDNSIPPTLTEPARIHGNDHSLTIAPVAFGIFFGNDTFLAFESSTSIAARVVITPGTDRNLAFATNTVGVDKESFELLAKRVASLHRRDRIWPKQAHQSTLLPRPL